MVAVAARKPWLARSTQRFLPRAAEMISPSTSAIGRPGHSGRNAQSSKKGVASMCAICSGSPVIDSAETYGGCVWITQFTSGLRL